MQMSLTLSATNKSTICIKFAGVECNFNCDKMWRSLNKKISGGYHFIVKDNELQMLKNCLPKWPLSPMKLKFILY